tara:strand:- start:1767 stop:1913 length:147 start_codon:yes stop_codon:yes gene_type:complete
MVSESKKKSPAGPAFEIIERKPNIENKNIKEVTKWYDSKNLFANKDTA